MTAGDIAAVGILGLFALLGLLGCFRWLYGLAVGLVAGIVLLGVVGLACHEPWVGHVGTFFNDSRVVSCARDQLVNVADSIRFGASEGPPADTESASSNSNDR